MLDWLLLLPPPFPVDTSAFGAWAIPG